MEITDINYLAQIDLLKNIIYFIGLIVAIWQVSTIKKHNNIKICIFLSILFAYFVSSPTINLHNWWNDHAVYAMQFIYSTSNASTLFKNDILFELLMKSIRFFTDNYKIFFFIIAIMYTLNYLWSSYRFSNKQAAFIPFIMFMTSLFFVSYGVNTLRAGLAMSILILAFSNYKRNKFLYVLFAICAINIHVSVALTLVSFIAAIIIKKPKMCFTIWLISIILSVSMGSYFEEIFKNIIEDDRKNTYLLVNADKTNYSVGFRWDFVVYSMIPIIIGYYYIYKKKFIDEMYNILYCTYLLANTFWILVIRANYTDRFAYLSWALMPLILIYPLINGQLFKHQNYVISLVVFLNVAFSFILSL